MAPSRWREVRRQIAPLATSRNTRRRRPRRVVQGDKFLRREIAPERKRRGERDATALFEGGSARAGGAVGLAAVAPGLRPFGDFSAVLDVESGEVAENERSHGLARAHRLVHVLVAEIVRAASALAAVRQKNEGGRDRSVPVGNESALRRGPPLPVGGGESHRKGDAA